MPISTLTPTYLIGLVTAVVCIAGALFVWWRKVRQRRKTASAEAAPGGSAAPPVAASGSKAVDDVFREANNCLKLAKKMKGASVASLPAFLIVGPQGAGKTNVMVHSGLDPELLAGQVYQGAEVRPTATLNIWLARQVVFIEIPASFATDANALKAIVKHLMPRGIGPAFSKDRPPRGFLLCTNQAPVAAAATPDEITALARPWNQCLALAAAALGVQFPVYVLFTKMDGVPGFAEFVSNLGPRESAQAVGAATRPFNAAAGGVYAEETARVVNQHFSNIAYTLGDSRVPLLRREQDRARLAVGYQFPREFQKLQKNLVQFLVEVGRPSQLQVSAFLRGFYFCGTRRVAVDRPGKQAGAAAAPPVSQDALNATTVLTPEQIRTQMAAARAGAEPPRAGHEITEWLFLPSVFESVLLRDKTAHGVSSTSLRTDRVRAAAFGVLGVLGLVAAAGLTTSYVCNRRLEEDLISAAGELADRSATASPFLRLEEMRKPLQRLVDYRSDTPLTMSWGLYRGNDLLAAARKIYCSEMRSPVLQPLVERMRRELAEFSTAGVDTVSAFDVLKAYMMMTSHPEHADATFLNKQLSETWKRTQQAGAAREADQWLPEQLRLYGGLLRVPVQQVPGEQDACLFQDASGVIPAAQAYLRGRNLDYQYRSLLAAAGKGHEAVNYDLKYPNDAVRDSQTVPAWFTRQGWDAMQERLKHPESLTADSWVLGESNQFSQEELSRKAAEYCSRYVADYAQAWKKYLDSASVKPYSNLEDAAAKLDKMSSQHSYLLNLIRLASEHTGSIEAMKGIFQPALAVAPATGDFQSAKEYLDKLDAIKNRLPSAAQPEGVPAVRTAVTEALDTTDKLAHSFRGDTDQAVKRILLAPIQSVPPLLGRQDVEAVNAAGKSLCASYGDAYPFSEKSTRSATFDQVQRVFDPQNGAMPQLYNQFLRESLDCIGDRCEERPNSKLKLQARFPDFFSRLYTWKSLLSSGGQLGQIRLSLRAKTFNQLKKLILSIDGTPLTLQAGGEAGPMNWDLNRSQGLRLNGEFAGGEAQGMFSTNVPGRWALFEWIFASEPNTGGADGFHWTPRGGVNSPLRLANNQTEDYKIEIQGPDGRPLDRRSLAVGSCVPPVAR
jgi:type VI secretion system protein ImpL